MNRCSERAHAARMAQRFFFTDGNYLGVRAIGAHKVPMSLPREIPVGNILPPTGEHPVVFQPAFEHQFFECAIRMLQGA